MAPYTSAPQHDDVAVISVEVLKLSDCVRRRLKVAEAALKKANKELK